MKDKKESTDNSRKSKTKAMNGTSDPSTSFTNGDVNGTLKDLKSGQKEEHEVSSSPVPQTIPQTNGNCDHKTSSNLNSSSHDETADTSVEVIKKNDINSSHKSSDKEDKDDSSKSSTSDQEFIFIHDTGFSVKIAAPCLEPFEMQVRDCFMKLVRYAHTLTFTHFSKHTKGKRHGACSRNSSLSYGSRRHLPSDMLLPSIK